MNILTKIAITSLAAFCVTTVHASEFGFASPKAKLQAQSIQKVQKLRGVVKVESKKGEGEVEAAAGARII